MASLDIKTAFDEARLRTVANDGSTTPCFCGRKVETEKRGSLVGLQRREEASDLQLYVGRQLLDYVPLQNVGTVRDLIEEAEMWDLAPTVVDKHV